MSFGEASVVFELVGLVHPFVGHVKYEVAVFEGAAANATVACSLAVRRHFDMNYLIISVQSVEMANLQYGGISLVLHRGIMEQKTK